MPYVYPNSNLPLSRLGGRGQLVDLRFASEETAAFLQQTLDLNLSAEEVAALEARTEGWITGLQLAALSMRGQQDKSNFIANFTGKDRHVVDYLLEEVFQGQPEQIQN